MTSEAPYSSIVRFCESCLEKYGDNYRGVGWTKTQNEVDIRYRVMLDVIVDAGTPVSILDFGCGASHLYEFIQRQRLKDLEYNGLDVSEAFLTLSRKKFPHVRYYDIDVLVDASTLPEFDYVLMNGVFTIKCDLSFEEMFRYLQSVVTRVFEKARRGIAFNVMSKQVDWERDDLFHLPVDDLASFLTGSVSRHFVVRHDYGLYEYTVYVYREPRR